MELIMGMITFFAGLLVVLGTVGFIESDSVINNVNTIAIAIQLILGFFLMYLGTEMLQESNK